MKQYLYGFLLTFFIALPAWFLGNAFPVIGSPVLGILFGMLVALFNRPSYFEVGIAYTSKKILKYAIILLGFNMPLGQIFAVGSQTLALMVFTLSATFMAAYVFGKLLHIERNANILIGVGTAICGGSAIAATAPVIAADDEEVAKSISTIFLFNVIAAFLFPALGHLFGMTDHFFGLWAGTAINDTSSVVAAGYAYSDAAGALAVVVKLTRTLMIIPVTLVLAIVESKRQHKQHAETFRFSKIFPWFVVGFLLTACLGTWVTSYTTIDNRILISLAKVGKFLIVMAMSAIGLKTHLGKLIKNGFAPLLLGFLCWITLSIVSVVVQIVML